MKRYIFLLILIFAATLNNVYAQPDVENQKIKSQLDSLKIEMEKLKLEMEKVAKESKKINIEIKNRDTLNASKRTLYKEEDYGIVKLKYYTKDSLNLDSLNENKRIENDVIEVDLDDEFKKKSKAEKNAAKPKKKLKNVESEWFLLDLGFNNYLHKGSLSLPTELQSFDLDAQRSVNVTLHLMEQRINLVKHKLNMHYSVALDYNNFHFENPVTLSQVADSVFTSGLTNVRKSKLATQTLMVPLRLQYESKPDRRSRSFRLAGGGYVGYLFHAHTKVVSNNDIKNKIRGGYHLENFKYGLTARVGYGPLTFYTNYSLNNLFQKGKGPELQPISFGIALLGF